MDKKNFLIGISLLVLAFVLMFQNVEKAYPPPEDPTADPGGTKPSNASSSSQSGEKDVSIQSNPEQPGKEDSNLTGIDKDSNNSTPTIQQAHGKDSQKQKDATYHKWNPNDEIEVTFTSDGGAIHEIRLKQTDRIRMEYVFKNPIKPALDVSFQKPDGPPPLANFDKSGYEITVSPDNSAATCVKKGNGVTITRTYRVSEDDPYLIDHTTKVENTGSVALPLERITFVIGMARPIADRQYNFFDDWRAYINIGYFNAGEEQNVGCRCANCSGRIDGEEDEFWQSNEFGEGVPPFTLSRAKWACVNNRFFVNILRPDEEKKDAIIDAEVIDLGEIPTFEKIYTEGQKGISGTFSYPFGTIEQGGYKEVTITYYAGPKDYVRLQELGHDQKTVMQFGIFWWVSEPLNAFLNLLYGWFGNFGWAIIVMTICVKLALWPLTAKSLKSQKKMQELQEPLQALRQKYKSNSQKMNQEMMKFYKEQGVNPLAGCWPMLIQIPIFLGLFWMLRSAAELRGAEFLWIKDLSEQDNIADLGSYSLNLLPLFMVVTQVIQMKLTPMNLGPNASDQQRIQAKMMRMMPYIFLVFLYFFSSALVLYWTIQNVLSIVQTLITKRGSDTIPIPVNTVEEPQEKTKVLDSVQHVSQEERTHRKALGLRLRGDLSKKEIKVAFKERIKRFHPDKIRNLGAKRQSQAEEKRKKLELAYEFLLNKG